MVHIRPRGILLSFCILIAATSLKAQIGSVAISRGSFNPTLAEAVSITVIVNSGGALDLAVLDRDGVVVRHLPHQEAPAAGEVLAQWDGRDDAGVIVPDEAYSLKIDFRGAAGAGSYFPANEIASFLVIKPDSYDRHSGILRYTLPRPSRVHIQAGSAVADVKSGIATGPVLKTVVDRQPRVEGSIVEQWMGLDESGTIRVSDLPNFVMSIAATPLPDNSMITIGNSSLAFRDAEWRKHTTSLLSAKNEVHAHHQGLRGGQDVTPTLEIIPEKAKWDAKARRWQRTTRGDLLHISLSPRGPNASEFVGQPGKVMVFIDFTRVFEAAVTPTLKQLTIKLPKGSRADHVVAVNWVSDYGPVAVNSFRIR